MQTQINRHSCSIIVPVYNEEKVISLTLEKIKEIILGIQNWEFEIICVNDGSKDRSGEILKQYTDIKVITHDINRGYGAALKTGLNSAQYDWVFIVDADATYPIEDLSKLLNEATLGAQMVVGARVGVGISSKPFHRIARWILRKITHFLTGTMVPDLNSGMRVFRHRLYREFKSLLPMGFSFTTTITLAALYSNYKTVYVPINYNRRVGKSNIKPLQDFFTFVMLILRIASYFEPLRFFLPIAFGIMGVGILKGAIDFFRLGAIGSLAVILYTMGVQVFVLGILAEVVVRRSNNSVENSGK